MSLMFRAFRSRNYRLFFGGQSISLIGTWMQNVAMQLLVYELTRSNALLGFISIVSALPAFLISPLAGAWLDMWDRRKLLVTTQALYGFQALALAILVFANVIQVWHLVALSVFQGLIGAFDMPGRQAFLVEMVHDREDLGNAIALNSSQFNVARLIGPVIAAVLINYVGEKACFLANAISYGAVVAALLLMAIPRRTPEIREKQIFQDMVDGWRYVRRSQTISALLLLLALTSLSYGMLAVLMPAFALDYFHGNRTTYAIIVLPTGLGAVVGAVILANKKTVRGLGTWAFWSALSFSLATAAFGFLPRHGFSLALLLLVFVGFGSMVNMASTNTLLQTLVDEHMRGRVMSFYTMSFILSMPFGSFAGGYLSTAIHLQGVCVLSGLISVIAGAWFYTRLPFMKRESRRILRSREAPAPAEPALTPGAGE